MKRFLCVAAAFVLISFAVDANAQKTVKRATGGRAQLKSVSKDPYKGAIVVDVATGKTVFEDNADTACYPASVVKLMDLLVILEQIDAGRVSLSNKITVSAEVSRMGGSGVYLKEGEVFTVEDLLYAMMVQSANDAALALAIHTGGTRDNFVKMMNKRAEAIGMESTVFSSPHGLPPSAGQRPDVSTPRDLAKLGLELVKRQDVFQYTATRERGFRDGKFIMRNHNGLLTKFEGCDGLKTGYFLAGGYSVVATAKRNDRRIVCVVVGSKEVYGRARDRAAATMMAEAFQNLPPLPPPPVATNVAVAATNAPPGSGTIFGGFDLRRGLILCGVLVVGLWVVAAILMRRRRTANY